MASLFASIRYHFMKSLFGSFFIFFTIIQSAVAQDQQADQARENAYFVWVGFSYDQPAEQLKDRFGASNAVGLAVEHLWGERQWFAGVNGYYGFGIDVKEDVLAGIRTPEGGVIGNNNSVAEVLLRQRYWYTGLYGGKVLGFLGKDRRSGLRVALGAGIWQHWIRVQDDSNAAAQVAGDYVRGYDRMTNGPALFTSLGYQHFSRNGLVNFYLSFEMTKGWLKHQRAWNFSDNIPGGEDRNDSLYSIRFAWALPFFYGGTEKVIYY